MEFIDKLSGSAGGMVTIALAFLLASNAFLSGLSKALELIKDKTKTDVDNKAYDVVGKILGYLQVVIDLLKGNFGSSKKDAPQVEVKKV